MIDIDDWDNVNWTNGEEYRALVGYTGQLFIKASDISIDMGEYRFNGNSGDHSVMIANQTDVELIGGEYFNAGIGVYVKQQPELDIDDRAYSGLTVKNAVTHHCTIGIKGFGSDIKIIGNQGSKHMDDGIWIRGDNAVIEYCNISDIDLGDMGGDCIQFDQSNNFRVHHCHLDHSNFATKQCIMGGYEGEGGVIEDNYMIGGKNVLYLGNNNMVARRNTIIPIAGTDRLIDITDVDGILTEDNYIVTKGRPPVFMYNSTNVINRNIVV